MGEWMRAPMTLDRSNFLALVVMPAIAVLALPALIRARDERRIRALEFAERVQKQTTAAPAE